MGNNSASSKETKKDRAPMANISKIFLIIAILTAPMAILAIVLYPMVAATNARKYGENFSLKNGFTRADVETVVAKMREDSDYQFYFKMLGKDSVQRAVDNVYAVLDQSRDQKKHLEEIENFKQQIHLTATLLNNIHYPDDFSKDPMAYPDLIKTFWGFIGQEFQLTILGLCYKSTYDINFQFHWSDSARQAAQKLEGLLFSLTNEQRKQIERSLNNPV